MGSLDILELCLRNLLRRRTRTMLAVTGVIVGTCAIVVMLSIGFGLTESYQQQIESYGNLHMIDVYGGGGWGASTASEEGALNDKTLAKIAKIEGVTAVTPADSEYIRLAIGKKIADVEITGIKPDVLEKFNFELSEGRLLRSTDRNVILFGNQIPYRFYDPNSNGRWQESEAEDVMTDKMILTGDWEYGQKKSIGVNTGDTQQKVKYKEYKVKGIGVLANENDQSSYQAYMTVDAFEKIRKEVRKARGEMVAPSAVKSYERAIVYVNDINDSEAVCEELRDKMKLQTSSPGDWLSQMKETAQMIQGVLGGIGGISLFVAALGITNTMIMSIYERTKEIGVMKVIGANLKDIRRLFLLEAGMIGLIGGCIGSAVSILLSILMNTVGKEAISIALGSMGGGYSDGPVSVIPWWVIAAALLFSTGIGMAAGFYPARRAMKLSALESLRNE